MEHPFTSVVFTEWCNVCGGTYPVTLYDIYREQQLAEEWQSARPGGDEHEHRQRLVAAVPNTELAAAMQAWEQLAASLNEHGLTFDVSSPVDTSGTAQHGSGR